MSAMRNPQKDAWQSDALKLHRGATFGEVSNVGEPVVSGRKRGFPQTGTAVAISYLPLGGVVLLPCSTGRGGARNRADRVSHALTAANVGNMVSATDHAGLIEMLFTRMITIHWKGAGVTLADMAKASGRFVDLLTKALARHGSGTAWLGVHENGDNKGWHFHLLVHVPAALVPIIQKLQLGWLGIITGKKYRKKVIYSRPIGKGLGAETRNPDDHAINLAVALGYVCKGAPQAVLDAFSIDRVHEPGGHIIGKRCATSQNIGAKARKSKD